MLNLQHYGYIHLQYQHIFHRTFHIQYNVCVGVLSQPCCLHVNINDSGVRATTCSTLQESLSNRKTIHEHLRAAGGLYFSPALCNIHTYKIHVFKPTAGQSIPLINAFSLFLSFLQQERGHNCTECLNSHRPM